MSMLVACAACGKLTSKTMWQINKGGQLFCGRACHSASHVRRISKMCKVCGNGFTVRPCESSRLSTCGKTCYLAARARANNGNWKGGITKSRKADLTTARYRNWRKSVFERDNYTCVDCGGRGGDKEADHIKPWAYFPDLRYEVSNGATRCRACHKKRTAEVFKWRKNLISEGKYSWEGPKRRSPTTLPCQECGKPFDQKVWNGIFCSQRCCGRSNQRKLRRRRGMKETPGLMPGQWARNYDGCIECRQSSAPHCCHGRCEICHGKWLKEFNPYGHRRASAQ